MTRNAGTCNLLPCHVCLSYCFAMGDKDVLLIHNATGICSVFGDTRGSAEPDGSRCRPGRCELWTARLKKSSHRRGPHRIYYDACSLLAAKPLIQKYRNKKQMHVWYIEEVSCWSMKLSSSKGLQGGVPLVEAIARTDVSL